MIKSLIKYPPQEQEACTYEVISNSRWDAAKHTERKANMRPVAGPYFDGEGWMLNAALAGFEGCNVALVEEFHVDGRGNKISGITIYRAAGELADIDEE